jgi:NitT/TauT family transport system ATP-binding protein
MEKIDSTIRLRLLNVSKVFQSSAKTTYALEKISLEVKEGEILCFVGPSGCGKTTLLNLIAGLDTPDEGEIYDGDQLVTAPGNDRVVMFQEPALFPWLNILDNVLFGLRLKPGISKKERIETARRLLNLVGLSENEKSYIHELSGGMKQRAALARSLAPNPHVLLMDEPFASLDAITREQLYYDLQQIMLREKKTVVFVTHNVSEAACLGDRILVFSIGPGKIIAEHKISLPRPRDIRSVKIAEVASRVTIDLRRVLEYKWEEAK